MYVLSLQTSWVVIESGENECDLMKINDRDVWNIWSKTEISLVGICIRARMS